MTEVVINFATEMAEATDGKATVSAAFPVDIVFPDERRFGHMELLDTFKAAEEMFDDDIPAAEAVWQLDLIGTPRDIQSQFPLKYRFIKQRYATPQEGDHFIRYSFDNNGREEAAVIDYKGREVESLGGCVDRDDLSGLEYTLNFKERCAYKEGYEVTGTWTTVWESEESAKNVPGPQFTEPSDHDEFIQELESIAGEPLPDHILSDMDEHYAEENVKEVGYRAFIAVRPCRYVGKPRWNPQWTSS